MNLLRCRRLIDRAIRVMDLDLHDFVVLTEAATGYYVLTPFIAALAGSPQVYTLAADSRYGSAQTSHDQTMSLCRSWDVTNVHVFFSREDERLGAADIVTNLGSVRPLDAGFISRLKREVVIPLMFETWEFRPEDLDMAECRRLGIPVAGTNEDDPRLQTFSYVGVLALKLLLQLDIEIFQSSIVVLGGGRFGEAVGKGLMQTGALVTQITMGDGEGLRSSEAKKALRSADAVVVAEHTDRRVIIGPQGQISARELAALNPGIVIAHICGSVDEIDIEREAIPHCPEKLARGGYMSVATDYTGPRPLIDLHAAGLKVGQALAGAVREGYHGIEAERHASRICSLVQPFGR